jgi:hypothetical protein
MNYWRLLHRLSTSDGPIGSATCTANAFLMVTTVLIPAEFVKRWEKQIDTPYSELTNEEKDSSIYQSLPNSSRATG